MDMSLIRAVWACWAVFLIIWAITSFQAKTSVRRPIASVGWIWRLGVLVIVVALGRAMARGLLPIVFFPYGVQVLGVALTALGIGFAVWARLTLGSNWGMPMTLRETPDLVTRGPYALVRHPIYTGILVGMIGTALAVGVLYFFVVLLACVYFMVSMGREEGDMQQHFPDAYPAYKARTKRLIPFVY
jgi:protein-S-isoprenylcysteine O-methyltransferase Ste14